MVVRKNSIPLCRLSCRGVTTRWRLEMKDKVREKEWGGPSCRPPSRSPSFSKYERYTRRTCNTYEHMITGRDVTKSQSVHTFTHPSWPQDFKNTIVLSKNLSNTASFSVKNKVIPKGNNLNFVPINYFFRYQNQFTAIFGLKRETCNR